MTVIEIRGKGQKGQKRLRILPVPEPTDGGTSLDLWSAQIDRILRAQRRLSADRPDPNRVWRWRGASSPRAAMETAKRAVGITVPDGRSIHTLRAMASHNLRHVVGFNRETAARMCGHSVQVQSTRYDRELEVQDYATYLRQVRESGG